MCNTCVVIDINECANNNGGCQHNCTNRNGSYNCSCAAGYKLTDNEHNCTEHSWCDKSPCLLIIPAAVFIMCILIGRQSTIILINNYIHYLLFLAVVITIFVRFLKEARREKSSPYTKLGYEHIHMTTKDSDGWKYKKLEDGDQ